MTMPCPRQARQAPWYRRPIRRRQRRGFRAAAHPTRCDVELPVRRYSQRQFWSAARVRCSLRQGARRGSRAAVTGATNKTDISTRRLMQSLRQSLLCCDGCTREAASVASARHRSAPVASRTSDGMEGFPSHPPG